MSVSAEPADAPSLNGGDQRWVVGAATLVVGLLGFLAYPTALDLGRQWYSDENYSHGFLIPLASAYLVWERRGQLLALAPRSSWGGFAAIVGGLGLFVLSAHAGAVFVQRISLLIVLAGLVAWVFGRQCLRILSMPLALLLFTIPLPLIAFNAIAFPLQGFAARVAEQTLQWLGIPVLRAGNVIILANTALEVAEACSGIRSVITLMALAATFACVTGMERGRGLILVAVSVPVAVAANAARVAGTGILAYYYGSRVADGFFHTVSGWLLFVLAIALLGLFGFIISVLGRRLARVRTSKPATIPAPAHGGSGLTWRLGLAAGLLTIAVVTIGAAPQAEGVPLRRSFDSFPDRLGSWQGVREALPPTTLRVLRVTDYLNRLYTRPGSLPIWLYVAYYESQPEGQSIHSPKVCLPGGGWAILAHRYLTVNLPGKTQPQTINRVLISKESDRQIVLYWYQERGRIVADEYRAGLHMVADAIRNKRTDGALIRFSAPVVGSEEATLVQMLDFVNAAYPELVAALPE